MTLIKLLASLHASCGARTENILSVGDYHYIYSIYRLIRIVLVCQ